MKTLYAIKMTRSRCSTVVQYTEDGGKTWKSPFPGIQDLEEIVLPVCGSDVVCSRSFIRHDCAKASRTVADAFERPKTGFIGFCCDSAHPFDETCRLDEADGGCPTWKACYDALADEVY